MGGWQGGELEGWELEAGSIHGPAGEGAGPTGGDGADGCEQVGSEGLVRSQARQAACSRVAAWTRDPGDLVPICA